MEGMDPGRIQKLLQNDVVFELKWCLLNYPILPALLVILVTRISLRRRGGARYWIPLVIQAVMVVQLWYDFGLLMELAVKSLIIRFTADLIIHFISRPLGQAITGLLFEREDRGSRSGLGRFDFGPNFENAWLIFSVGDYFDMVYVVATCRACIHMGVGITQLIMYAN